MDRVSEDIKELVKRIFNCAHSLEESLPMLLWEENLELDDITYPLEELREAITSLEHAEEYLNEHLQDQ